MVSRGTLIGDRALAHNCIAIAEKIELFVGYFLRVRGAAAHGAVTEMCHCAAPGSG